MNLTKAKAMADALLVEHGIAKEWSFRFDRSKTRHGQARDVMVRGKNVKEITASRYIAEKSTEESFKDTVLHEIAHVVAGLENGHNNVWKAVARRLGAKDEEYGVGDVDIIWDLAPYKYHCSVDQEMIMFSHRPLSVANLGCPAHPKADIIRLHNGSEDAIVNEI